MKLRHFIAGSALLVSQSAGSQPSRYFCTPFTPTQEEVVVLIESVPELPEIAVSGGGCYRLEQQLTGVSTLSDIRVETYWFSWPTDEYEAGVRFHRRIGCSRTGTRPLNCEDSERFAGWQGTLVRIDPRMSSFEIAEVLRETDKLVPGTIYELARGRSSQRRTRFDGSIEYRVIATLGGASGGVSADRYSFTIYRNCDGFGRCNWTSSSGSRIYYGILP
jgi:hypothetical protein